MPLDFLLKAPIGLAPVLIFLVVLLHLDSFKLVDFYTVLQTLLIGCLVAIACYLINGVAMGLLHFDFAHYSRYAAPVIEECLKASVLIYLFVRNCIGFMVDAAILGFAVGAGFSLVENIYYLYAFPEANFGVALVRGFGTAIMHGGVTAVFGVLAQSLTDRHAKFNPALYLPGLAVAIIMHATFNFFPGFPLLATVGTLVILPMTLLLVFAKSEHAIHKWLITDYQSHEHLLQDIRSGEFQHSAAGRFIVDLAEKFDDAVAADTFAYIRLHTELVLRIEKISLARESGERIPIVQEDWDSFDQLHALERKIGKTALLVIWPHLDFSRRELWELYEIEHQARLHHSGSQKR